MTQFIILNEIDVNLLKKNKPVVLRINDIPHVICTEEYFENRKREDKE